MLGLTFESLIHFECEYSVFLQVKGLSFEKKINSVRWKHEFIVLERKNTFKEKNRK